MFGNLRIQFPDIRRRNLDKFSERPVLINPDNPQVLANVRLPQPALTTMSAIHVHFRAYKIAWLDRAHLIAHALDGAAEFMPQRHRRLDAPLRPAVPPVNVQVRPANRSRLYAHQHVGRPDQRHRDRIHLQAAGRLHLPQRLHRRRHLRRSSLNTQISMLAHHIPSATVGARYIVPLFAPSTTSPVR